VKYDLCLISIFRLFRKKIWCGGYCYEQKGHNKIPQSEMPGCRKETEKELIRTQSCPVAEIPLCP
jgi:hypothetical protein